MSHQLARLVAGVVVLTCLLGIGTAMVGATAVSPTSAAVADDPAANATDDWDQNGTVVDRTFVDVETGETYDFPPGETVETLPAGDYLAVQEVQVGDETEQQTATCRSLSRQLSHPQHTTPT
jgi:hypothetical protein